MAIIIKNRIVAYSSGTVSSGISIQQSGFLAVEDGAQVYDVEVKEVQGILQVKDGGYASKVTVLQSGYVENSGTMENVWIYEKGMLCVTDGAVVYNVETSGPSGILQVKDGGYVSGITVRQSGYVENSGRIEHLRIVSAAGAMISVTGGTVDDTEISGDGAVMDVSGAAIKNGISVDGSSFLFGHNTVFSSVVLKNGGVQSLDQGSFDTGTRIFTGGAQQVSSGARVYDAVLLGHGSHSCTGEEKYNDGKDEDKAYQLLFSGGYASHTTVHSSAGQVVKSGASADKTEIFDHGSLIVSNGGVMHDAVMHHGLAEWHAPYLLLEGKGWNIAASAYCDFYVRSGGSAQFSEICGCTEAETSGIVDDYDGWQTLAAGGSASNTTVLYRGLQGHSSGASSVDNYISRGGGQSLEDNCTAINNYFLGGIQYVGNTSSPWTVPGIAVNNHFEGGSQIVYSPGLVSETFLSANAQQWLEGGSATGNFVNCASQFIEKGTAVNNVVTGKDALQWIAPYGSAVDNTLQNGATQVVSGGFASGNELLDADQEIYGGSASDNHLSGGSQIVDGGFALNNTLRDATQWVSGGKTEKTRIYNGSQVMQDQAITENTTIISGVQMIYAGSASDNRLSGGSQAISGGCAVRNILQDAVQWVSGGQAENTQILNGSQVMEAQAVTRSNTVISGVQTIYNGSAFLNRLSAGSQMISGGYAADNILRNAVQWVTGGQVENTQITNGSQVIEGQAVTQSTAIVTGDQMIYDGSATENYLSGGSQMIFGGQAVSNTLQDAVQWLIGGRIENTQITNGSQIIENETVTCNNTILISGSQMIYNGSATENHLSGGSQMVTGGSVTNNTLQDAIQWVTGGQVENTQISNGSQVMENEAVTRSTTIISGGQLVYGGSALFNTITSGKQYLAGSAYTSHSILSDTELQITDSSIAEDIVLYGGSVADGSNTTINGLTLVGVSADFSGKLSNLTISSDCSVRLFGATVTGSIRIAGTLSHINATAQADFTFAITAGREKDSFFLNQYLTDSTYSIYVDPEADAGYYLLVNDQTGYEGTEKFSICNSEGTVAATISSGETVTVLGRTYTLQKTVWEGLRLTVSALDKDWLDPDSSSCPVSADSAACMETENEYSHISKIPEADFSSSGDDWTDILPFDFGDEELQEPVITASTTERTNQNVTLSASVADGLSAEYRLPGGKWTACSGSVVVDRNTAVQFRSADNKGNYSDTVSVIVSNIDKEAPGFPVGFHVRKAGTTVNITWKAAEESDFGGYRIRYGSTADLQGTGTTVSENSFTVENFSGDVFYYQVQAFDTLGNSSAWSYVRNEVMSDAAGTPCGDVDGNGLADIVMAIAGEEHPYKGAVGAWLIHEDQIPTWGDLSTLSSGWVLLGKGKTSAVKTSSDIYIRSSDNIVGAWVTDYAGKVSGWQTIGVFDATANVLGCGDFNGDGQSDLLLRSDSGAVGCYYTSGEKAGWNYFQSLGNEWQICGIGDLNGDGRDDIVLKHDAGFAGSWLTQEDGTVVWADLDTLSSGFEIVGCGDFNGDGIDDVLLKNGSYCGAWLVENGNAKGWMGLGDLGDAAVEEIDDFNGDGKDDLRIRTAAGDIGAQIVKGPDTLQWQYYGSVGSEWSTSLASI